MTFLTLLVDVVDQLLDRCRDRMLASGKDLRLFIIARNRLAQDMSEKDDLKLVQMVDL